MLSNGDLWDIFEFGSKGRREFLLHDYLIRHWRQLRLERLEHDWNIELQRLQFFHLHLPSLEIFKRVVLLFLVAIKIIVLVIMLGDDVKPAQVVDKRPLNVGQLLILLDFFIGLEVEVRSQEFVEHVIIHLLSIIHFFAGLYCYPRNCEHKLEKQQARITIVLYLRIL